MDDKNLFPDLPTDEQLDLLGSMRRRHMDKKSERIRLIDLLMGPPTSSQRIRVIPPHVMALLDAFEHVEKSALEQIWHQAGLDRKGAESAPRFIERSRP